jgi:hypothetical protein
MYNYLEPIIGIPVSNLSTPSKLLEEFYEVVVLEFDMTSINSTQHWQRFDEYFQDMHDASSPLLKELLTFISLNRDHLEIVSFYSGSHEENPCSISFKTNVDLTLEEVESSTWRLDKLMAIQAEIKDIETYIIQEQMSPELYNEIKPFFGLSFIAATS